MKPSTSQLTSCLLSLLSALSSLLEPFLPLCLDIIHATILLHCQGLQLQRLANKAM